jgi:hypothetical protein
MMLRCSNPDHPSYKWYGGRGIVVDPAWYDVRQFVADMGEPPPGLSLGRINNDGPYSKANCRWETWDQQCGNKRGHRLITHGGVTLNVVGWAKRLGVNPKRLYHRMSQHGFTPEEAVTIPFRGPGCRARKKLRRQ